MLIINVFRWLLVYLGTDFILGVLRRRKEKKDKTKHLSGIKENKDGSRRDNALVVSVYLCI